MPPSPDHRGCFILPATWALHPIRPCVFHLTLAKGTCPRARAGKLLPGSKRVFFGGTTDVRCTGNRMSRRGPRAIKFLAQAVHAQDEAASAPELGRVARMQVDILSLFPGYFDGPLRESILGQARSKGILDVRLTNIRDFAENKHGRVDDRPYGGGPGMVLMAEPVMRAIASVSTESAHVIYLSPQGRPLTADRCMALAEKAHVVLLCGHYEGLDERAVQRVVDEEVSIGDYVLTNGCAAAVVLVDAVARFVPGVLGHADAAAQDSFTARPTSQPHSVLSPIFDCPHYTRPEVLTNGDAVPPVLLGGNPQEVNRWRYTRALEKTQLVRPDLYAAHLRTSGPDSSTREASSSEQTWTLAGVTLPTSSVRACAKLYGKGLGLPVIESGSPDGSARRLVVTISDKHQLMFIETTPSAVTSDPDHATEQSPAESGALVQLTVSDVMAVALRLAARRIAYEPVHEADGSLRSIAVRDPDGRLCVMEQCALLPS